jgi:phage gp29-like protein
MDNAYQTLALQPLQWGENLEYKPSNIISITQSADSGDLEPLADFCDWLLADDRCKSTLNTRANALFGSQLEFEGEYGELWNKYWTESFPESTLNQWLVMALLAGLSALNVAWEQDSSGIWWPKIQYWHLRNLKFSFQVRKWEAVGDQGYRHIIEDNDPAWCVLTPGGASRAWMNGSWRNVALWVLGKQLAWRDWNRRNEIAGIGILKGMCPQGTSLADKKQFAADIKSLGRNSKIILEEGYDVNLEENKPFTWQTFGDCIKSANTVIAISHLGQNLTTEVDGGSYAATLAHGTVRQDYLASDAQTMATTLHDWLLSNWSKFNGLPAPWPKWKVSPPEDAKLAADTAKSRAESIKAMVEAVKLLQEMGVQVDIRELISEQIKVQTESEKQEGEELSHKCACRVHALAAKPIQLTKSQELIDELVKENVEANDLSQWIDEILHEINVTKDDNGWELDLVRRLNAKLKSSNIGVDRFAEAMERALVVAQMASGLTGEEDGE